MSDKLKPYKLDRNMPMPGTRPQIIEPDKMWFAFIDYMEYNSKISWGKSFPVTSGPKSGTFVDIQIPNPPTLYGFAAYTGISENEFKHMRITPTHPCFEVACGIETHIKSVQVGGAMVNIYNAAITARLTGLVDKREIEVTQNMSDDERMDTIKEILEKTRRLGP